MKTYFDKEPSKLEYVDGNSYRYRWNIHKISLDSDIEQQEHWVADEVLVPNTQVVPDQLISTVINELWPIDYEQKLINEYNSAIMGLYSDDTLTSSKVEAYKNFLNKRQEIKDNIKTDCLELGILG